MRIVPLVLPLALPLLAPLGDASCHDCFHGPEPAQSAYDFVWRFLP